MGFGVRVTGCLHKTLGIFGVTCALSMQALASGGGEKFKEGVNYIPLKPAMIVNYASNGSKVRYIRAEISLRTEDAANAQIVSHNMAVVRDTLIMYMSSLTQEELSSGEGKEHMRVTALEKINEALEEVEHPSKGDKHGEKHGDKGGKEATDHHAKADDHAKAGDHAAAEDHGKADAHGKSTKEKSASHSESAAGPVSDLLFDNLVVQP